MKQLLFIAVFIIASAQLAHATNYYVDNSSTGCGGSGCLDTNAGTSLATAWKTAAKAQGHTYAAGDTLCFQPQSNPNTTNGGIWREAFSLAGGGTAFGANQVTIESCDVVRSVSPIKLPIFTGADCLGASSGLCTGSTAVTWHHCTSNDATCESNINANITNVYEYTTGGTAYGASIYVDDPNPINSTSLWRTSTSTPSATWLSWASGLPGAGSSTAADHYQGDMTSGSFYYNSANNHLYIWLSDASDPGTHIIEAVSRGGVPTNASGLFKLYSSANTFVQLSYLQCQYSMSTCVDIHNNSALSVNVDHLHVGGTGAGPVTNSSTQGFYTSAIAFIIGGTAPSGTTPAGSFSVTNNVVNWCGSHNCIEVQGNSGTTTETSNTVGTSEHNGIDFHCGGTTITVSNDIVHDSWEGAITGSDSSLESNAYYLERDYTACPASTITWKDDIATNYSVGFFCNIGSINAGTLTCNDYNTTVTLNPNPRNANSEFCFYTQSNTGTTITRDTEDNICYMTGGSGAQGFKVPTISGTLTITEKYNLYYNTSGTTTNSYNGTNSTTLSTWQSNCGGSGACGTADVWQTDPKLANAAAGSILRSDGIYAPISNNLAPTPSSPAIGSSNPAVGPGVTYMGDQPPIYLSGSIKGGMP